MIDQMYNELHVLYSKPQTLSYGSIPTLYNIIVF